MYDLNVEVTPLEDSLVVECFLEGPTQPQVKVEDLLYRCNDAVYGYLVSASLGLSESEMKSFFSRDYEYSGSYHREKLSSEGIEVKDRSQFSYRRELEVSVLPNKAV
jgi:hypothetical protein